MKKAIKVAIAGVGNCASSLVQGVEYYRNRQGEALDGVMRQSIGGYSCGDVEFVAAFDIDRRKVGHPLEEAIFAKPNCTRIFQSALPVSNVIVQAGPVLDGIAPHMADYPDDTAFRSADIEPTDVAAALRTSGAEVLVCYMPVGSEQAVKHYAQACLDAHVAMINCVPVFLASDPDWAQKFWDAGIPIVGDDIKSQVGATIVHRALARLSKTESVQSQLDERLDARDIHIGPSDYVAWQKDNKVCFIRMEGRGFGDSPMELELRLSVQDSPNSAGVVIDAVRCVKLALERGEAGPLEAPSAYYMKSPPRQIRDSIAREACNAFIDGRDFDLPEETARSAKVVVRPRRS